MWFLGRSQHCCVTVFTHPALQNTFSAVSFKPLEGEVSFSLNALSSCTIRHRYMITVDQKCFQIIISYNVCSAKAFAGSICVFQDALQREWRTLFYKWDWLCPRKQKWPRSLKEPLFLQSCEQHQMSVFFMLSVVFPVHLCRWKIFFSNLIFEIELTLQLDMSHKSKREDCSS